MSSKESTQSTTSDPTNSPTEPATVVALKDKITEIFGLDVRSLALYRVCLGILLIGELLARLSDLRAHYTDFGVVPRFILPQSIGMSIHTMSGSAWWQYLLFGVAGVFATMLLIGLQTRLATLVSWFLLVSLQARNPAIMHNGDVMLRMMLFWAIFLPLGACYSVDSRFRPRPEGASTMIISAGTIAYILQLVFVYWFAMLWKHAPEWRIHRTAVSIALHAEPLTSHLGIWARQYPDMLKFLTVTTLLVEGIGPALVLFPFFTQSLRILAVVTFWGLHTGFGLFIVLGNFTPVMYVAWVIVLPPLFWGLLQRFFTNEERRGLTLYYDRSDRTSWGRVGLLWSIVLFYQSRCVSFDESEAGSRRRQDGDRWLLVDADGNELRGVDAVLRALRVSPVFWWLAWILARPWCRARLEARYKKSSERPVEPIRERIPTWWELAWSNVTSPTYNLLVFFFLIYIFLWNVRSLTERYPPAFRSFVMQILPPQMNNFAWAMSFEQSWGVFAPSPGKSHGWYSIFVTTRLGERFYIENEGNSLRVTPVRGKDEDAEKKPEYVAGAYINSRWRRYLQNMPDPMYARYRAYYAQYLIRLWNEEYPDKPLARLEIYFHIVKTTEKGLTDPVRIPLYLHSESGSPPSASAQ